MSVWSVIVNYKTAPLTLKAVDALNRALGNVEGKHRTLVVDNDSQDGSYETLMAGIGSAQGIEVIASDHNGGYGYGNNVGFRLGLAASPPPDYFYVLNSDAFPEPQAVRLLVEYMDQHPEVGIAGSHIRGVDGVPHRTAFRFPTIRGEFETAIRLGVVTRLFRKQVTAMPIPTEPTAVDWVSGASMLIRREVLEEAGLFDESFFLYFEEVDLCRRVSAVGRSIHYVPSSKIEHVGSASTGWRDFDKTMPDYWFDSRRLYFTKNHGRMYLWVANMAQVVGMSLGGIKSWIKREPSARHKNFFRDFLKHNFRPWRKSP